MLTNSRDRAWVEIQADALLRNASVLQQVVGPGSELIPMVKANAYGLGLSATVRTLEAINPWGFGVATLSEGLELRRLGVTCPILVVSPLPPASTELAVEAGLQLGISNPESLRLVTSAAERVGRAADIHIEIDTGIGRAGFNWKDAGSWKRYLDDAIKLGVRWAGSYTHLHSADEGHDTVLEQWTRFQEALRQLDVPDNMLVHVVNSAGALRLPELAASAIRTGIFLYGGSAGVGLPDPEPVVSVRARVVHMRQAHAGDTVGYGATYRAESNEHWASLGIGYGDGIPRLLGNRGSILIHGCRAPIIGRISMDVTVVNISEIPNVSLGDIATLIGSDKDEQITVDEIAEQADTIGYEILTGLSPRLPRIWKGLDGQ
ncbi:MAG: alanine racemase [Gemmatimonadetes bacterium]|nr:alanine racemase [Gemmatimonadota bacterium]